MTAIVDAGGVSIRCDGERCRSRIDQEYLERPSFDVVDYWRRQLAAEGWTASGEPGRRKDWCPNHTPPANRSWVVHIDEDLHDRLRDRCRRDRMQMKSVVEALVLAYLKEEAPAVAPPPPALPDTSKTVHVPDLPAGHPFFNRKDK